MQETQKTLLYIFFVVLLGLGGAFLFIRQDEREQREGRGSATGTGAQKQRTHDGENTSVVPFTPQAPFGNWDDKRLSLGCEEASAIMAMRWVRGEPLTLREAQEEIIAISDFELQNYGEFRDASARDSVERIYKSYFGYDNVELRYDIGTRDILAELRNGNIAVVPVDGTKLGNPFYTDLGPPQHQVVVWDYDDATDEFIAHDPGTKRGEGFRYSSTALQAALRDYPTGYREPVPNPRTAMIVVRPQ